MILNYRLIFALAVAGAAGGCAGVRVESLGRVSPEGVVTLSADCRHVAVVVNDREAILTVDGKPYTHKPRIGSVALSFDGARVGYAAYGESGGILPKVDVVVDGVGHVYGLVRRDVVPVPPPQIVFSADGKRVAWCNVTNEEGQAVVVEDGTVEDAYRATGEVDIFGSALVFSPDGQRLAWMRSVHDGKSPLEDGVQWLINGYQGQVHGSVWGPVVFSPDGKRTAYFASPETLMAAEGRSWRSVVIDGTAETSSFVGQVGKIAFGPDSQEVAYSVSEERPGPMGPWLEHWLVVERMDAAGGVSKRVEALGEAVAGGMAWSADGKHFAYVKVWREADAKQPGEWVYPGMLNVDGKDVKESYAVGRKGAGYEAGVLCTLMPPVFSPDGRHMAYGAMQDGVWMLMLDGKAVKGYRLVAAEESGRPLGELMAAWRTFSGAGVLPYHFAEDGKLNFVGEKDGELFRLEVGAGWGRLP